MVNRVFRGILVVLAICEAAWTADIRGTVIIEHKLTSRTVTARAGSTVTFPNLDVIFHNVFSLSTAGSFRRRVQVSETQGAEIEFFIPLDAGGSPKPAARR